MAARTMILSEIENCDFCSRLVRSPPGLQHSRKISFSFHFPQIIAVLDRAVILRQSSELEAHSALEACAIPEHPPGPGCLRGRPRSNIYFLYGDETGSPLGPGSLCDTRAPTRSWKPLRFKSSPASKVFQNSV